MFRLDMYFVLDSLKVRLVAMPEKSNNCDRFSSQPLEEFLANNSKKKSDVNIKSVSIPHHVPLAGMLHYSSGRSGYDSINEIKWKRRERKAGKGRRAVVDLESLRSFKIGDTVNSPAIQDSSRPLQPTRTQEPLQEFCSHNSEKNSDISDVLQ